VAEAEPVETEPADGLSDEERTRLRWRYREARASGLSIVESKIFAEARDLDIGQLRHLVELGCPRDLIPRVLL
jgi:hypothetical protein